MVNWAGINLSIITSNGKPTPSCSELHGFSLPSHIELYRLSSRPSQIKKNVESLIAEQNTAVKTEGEIAKVWLARLVKLLNLCRGGIREGQRYDDGVIVGVFPVHLKETWVDNSCMVMSRLFYNVLSKPKNVKYLFITPVSFY